MTYEPSNAFEPPIDENVNFSKDFNKFLDQITRRYRDIARKLNEKERAYYPLNLEIVNDQKYYSVDNPQKYRSVFRKVFAFDAVATGAALNIPHYITGNFETVRLYGIAITAIDERTLPFVDITLISNQTMLTRTGANIVITNGATATALVSGKVIIEYLKF